MKYAPLIAWGAASAYFIVRALLPAGENCQQLSASEAVTIQAASTDFVGDIAYSIGVDPALIRAIIAVESGGNPYAVGAAGERGLMQLMPWLCSGIDPFDPAQNVERGVRHFAECLALCNGSAHAALRMYNSGRPGIAGYAYASRVLRVKEGL